MNTKDINNEEKPIIYIDEKPEVIPGQGQGEVPVITIERDDTPSDQPSSPSAPTGKRRWSLLRIIGVAGLAAVAFSAAMLAGWRYYNTYINIGIPVSTTSAENIAKLQAPVSTITPEVVKTSDSILGVAMNFYELRGLKAEISMQEPDTTDQSVYLYSRCSDYHKDFSIIGSLVMDGQEVETVDNYRLGYFAAANDQSVIGIARDEKVKEYVKKQRGCFFRQFILVSAGVLPRQFYLHGKVERRGIGRMSNGKLYYLESRYKETMWDFADALREYGFVDAIYITGGYDYCFYRTADGTRHDISNPLNYPHKNAGQVPWLIFRKR